MGTYDKRIKKMMRIFHGFRKINIAVFLNNISDKNLFLKYVYYLIPFLMFGLNIYNMIASKVLYSKNPGLFTYMADMSNSLGLTALSFISYFLSGYFPKMYDEFINKGVQDGKELQYEEKKSSLWWILNALILFTIGFVAGYTFHATAKANVAAYWIYNLSDFGKLFYCLFLGITWYYSLALLGMALSAGGVIFFSIKAKRLIYLDDNYNKNFSIVKASDILMYTFSYGVFYISGAVLFIINDHLAVSKYSVRNAFASDINSFWLMLIVTAIVVLAFVPLQELFYFMEEKRQVLLIRLNTDIQNEKVIEKRNEMIVYRNNLFSQGLIFTSFSSRLALILSIIIPLLGVLFQAIDILLTAIKQ